jgi:hypothetical protein
MEPTQAPKFLRSRDGALHNYPKLNELCSQPSALTHSDRVLANLDRPQTLENHPIQHKHPKSMLQSVQPPQYLAQPTKELHNLHSAKHKWYTPIKLKGPQ